MSEIESTKPWAAPGPGGETSIRQTIGASLAAGLMGPTLTVLIGSLAFLLVVPPADIPDLLADLSDGIPCCGANPEGAAKCEEMLGWRWPALMIWPALTGVLVTSFALDFAFSIFRRASWTWVSVIYLGSYVGPGLFLVHAFGRRGVFLDANSIPHIGLEFVLVTAGALLVASGTIGAFLAWLHWDLRFKLMSYWVPANEVAPQDGLHEQSAHSRDVPPAEFFLDIDRRKLRALISPGSFALLYALIGIGIFFWADSVAPADSGGVMVIGLGAALFCLPLAIRNGLFFLDGLADIKRRHLQIEIDSRGLGLERGSIPWREIGRVWVGGAEHRDVVIEVPAVTEKVFHDRLPWPRRVLLLGMSRFKRRYLGAHSLLLDIPILDCNAEELREAIEARRPPGTRWVPEPTG